MTNEKNKEALAIVKQMVADGQVTQDVAEKYFPELKESEDDKIRKAIYNCIKWFGFDSCFFKDVSQEECLSWLEKQVKQKPADKVEPKFKVGDWINGYYTNYKVLSVNKDGYVVEDVDGNKINILFENEKFHHLWTIQDAKDGDVLSNGKMIVIFKHFEEPSYRQHIVAYIGLDTNGDIQITDDTWNLGIDKTRPTTKEQRDILFQKMKEAGYEWDAEKKELKKIVQKSFARYKVGDTIYYDSFGRLVSFVIANIVEDGTDNPMYEDKDGNSVFQNDIIEQKNAWSEEDEKMLNDTIQFIETGWTDNGKSHLIPWLKSLRPQSKWKPTEEQIKALRNVSMKSASDISRQTQVLGELYEQLKEL